MKLLIFCLIISNYQSVRKTEKNKLGRNNLNFMHVFLNNLKKYLLKFIHLSTFKYSVIDYSLIFFILHDSKRGVLISEITKNFAPCVITRYSIRRDYILKTRASTLNC